MEARILELEARQTDLDARVLAAFAAHETRAEGEALSRELDSVRAELRTCYEAWEAAAAGLEGS